MFALIVVLILVLGIANLASEVKYWKRGELPPSRRTGMEYAAFKSEVGRLHDARKQRRQEDAHARRLMLNQLDRKEQTELRQR